MPSYTPSSLSNLFSTLLYTQKRSPVNNTSVILYLLVLMKLVLCRGCQIRTGGTLLGFAGLANLWFKPLTQPSIIDTLHSTISYNSTRSVFNIPLFNYRLVVAYDNFFKLLPLMFPSVSLVKYCVKINMR